MAGGRVDAAGRLGMAIGPDARLGSRGRRDRPDGRIAAARCVADLSVIETHPLRARALRQVTGLQAVGGAPLATDAGSFNLVSDAVGVAATRELAIAAIAAIAAGDVVAHVDLGGWTRALDWRELTLRKAALIGCDTYTTADPESAVAALDGGELNDLAWLEERALSAGAAAFDDQTGRPCGREQDLVAAWPMSRRAVPNSNGGALWREGTSTSRRAASKRIPQRFGAKVWQ